MHCIPLFFIQSPLSIIVVIYKLKSKQRQERQPVSIVYNQQDLHTFKKIYKFDKMMNPMFIYKYHQTHSSLQQ